MSLRRLSIDRYRVSTNPLRTQRKIELAVVLLLLVLCFQLLYSGARFAMLATPEAVAPAQDALKVKNVRNSGSVSSVQSAEIQGRPLFWEGRRPVQEAVAVVEKKNPATKAAELKGIKLLGVFGGAEATGIIVIEKGKTRRLLQGEELRGWIIDTVDSNQVVLKSGARTETLLLRQGAIAGMPSSAATAPAEKEAGAPAPKSKPRKNPGGGEGGLSLGGRPRS